MSEIRAFVAIELSDELREELKNAQRKLRGAPGSEFIRWVVPSNIHLTLKFLGSVDTARVPEITAALIRGASDTPRFHLVARGMGCFPNTRRPNNVWVGLEGDLPPLLRLAGRIEEACAALGFEREGRAFSPHLTLGRVRREARPSERAELGQMIEDLQRAMYGGIPVDAVRLIQSDLRPSGPIYTVLEKIPLA